MRLSKSIAPSSGLIDLDIRQHVQKMNPSSIGVAAAIERTLQDRRDEDLAWDYARQVRQGIA